MSNIRIKDLSTTATSTAADDFLGIDGATNGTRKMAAQTPVFNSVTANATTDLTLAGGSSGASLVLGQGTNGAVTITPTGSTYVTVAARTADGSAGGLLVTGGASGAGTIRLSGSVLSAGSPGIWFNDGGSPSAANYALISGSTDTLINKASGAGVLDFRSTNTTFARFSATNHNLLIGGTTDITGSGGLKVFGTTAASSTTTGALQVAGGVGVAGAGWFGSTVTSSASDTKVYSASSGATFNSRFTASNTSSPTLGYNAFIGFGNSNNAAGYFGYVQNASGYADFVWNQATTGFAETMRLTSGGNLTLAGNLTVSSTTDASSGAGALVVSGGAYVAKQVWIGGSGTNGVLNLPSGTDKTQGIAFGTDTSLYRRGGGGLQLDSGGDSYFVANGAATGNAASFQFWKVGSQKWNLTSVATTHDLAFYNNGGINANALTLEYSTGNATFAGNIKTAAPTSGTAKAWKLGEVATVSPTSPNRTIRVEIDGTLYYISAKTTND